MKDKIDKWAFSTFKDRDAAEWSSRWLGIFFSSDTPIAVMAGMSQMFSGFNGNPFFIKNQGQLYPLCAHAIQSYAESALAISLDGQTDHASSGISQAIEPIVMAGRLSGIQDIRKSVFDLIKGS